MAVISGRIANKLREQLQWMRSDVQGSFDAHQNVAAALQICCYTEALARLRAGTAVDWPRDGERVFIEFMRRYFPLFEDAQRRLGEFRICSSRKKGETELVTAYEAFYRLWRHGIVHEYFPKARSMITRTSDAPPPHRYLTAHANRKGPKDPDNHFAKRLHVHLDFLVCDFMAGSMAFEEDVLNPASAELQANCVKRLEFLAK